MTVYLVYQTTPLIGGIRPICCYKHQKDAEDYCLKCNVHGNGFGILELNLYGDQDGHSRG